MATEHLLRIGRRRIGTIAGPQDMSAGLDRLAGWAAALGEVGLATDAVAYGDFTTTGGAGATAKLLAEHPDINALFVASDLMAVGALSVLAGAGRLVPGDVAVVGYDNMGAAATTSPTLTTIVNPVVAMARTAGEMLIDLLNGKNVRPRTGHLSPRAGDPTLGVVLIPNQCRQLPSRREGRCVIGGCA